MSSDSNSEIREEIKYTNVNIARFRRDIPDIFRQIIREEIRTEFARLLRELRKPKPYVEVGYRG